MIYGIGLPRTGTTTLKKALEILGVEAKVGDYVHFLPSWDGKKILTVRTEPEIWYNSVLKRNITVGTMGAIIRQRVKMYGSTQPETYWMDIYRHHKRVCSKLPDTLVVCWERGDGWKELCEFLDKPIPDIGFPHLNKSR